MGPDTHSKESMEYRKWNNKDISTSLLGYGCMRLPTCADGSIDESRAAALLNAARDAGVNYFDTAYPYHGGASEPFVGRVIAQWPRESFYLATKLPVWKVNTLDDAKQLFNEQLRRLGVEYFDFYLLHALHAQRYEKVKSLGVVEWLWEQKAAGRIRNFGFSFHDNYAVLETILNDQPWDFCQLQYNYLDTNEEAGTQAGDKGYALAESKGIPVVVMEPVKGGTLASLPEDAAAPLKALRSNASMASWALRWVGTHPGVKVILSGMTTEEQVADNLSTFASFQPLDEAEQAAVVQAAATLRSRIRVGCTACRYCMPCPMGVDIPENFRVWNRYAMFGNAEAAKQAWGKRFDDKEKAKNCVRCGKCEAACPQQLPIRDCLAQLQAELDALVEG